jgi:hypothetical protein
LSYILNISSSTASPATFQDSYNAAFLVASCLNADCDRLAVISTSERLLMPLRRVNMKSARTALGTLTTPNEVDRSERSVSDMWKFAIKLITNAGARRQSTLGHIFLISHEVERFSAFPRHNAVQIHAINTGIVTALSTWRGPGWALESDVLRSDRNGLAQQLCSVLRQLRTGINPGYLSDVEVKLKPGPGCNVEVVLGSTHFDAVGAGQTKELFVKMNVGTVAESWIHDTIAYKSFSHDEIPSQPLTPERIEEMGEQEGRSSTEELIAELDYLLGEGRSVILTVEVKYRHSLLPAHTILSVTESCSLEKIGAWGFSVSKRTIPRPGHEEEVQKRLMRFVTTSSGPQEGLKTLKEWFGDGGSEFACPGDMRMILDELKYYLSERYHDVDKDEHNNSQSDHEEIDPCTALGDITNRPRTSSVSTARTNTPTSRSTSVVRKLRKEDSWVSAPATEFENSNCLDSNSDLGLGDGGGDTTVSTTMNDMELTSTDRAVDELVRSVPVTDPARMIWGKIRMMSSSPRGKGDGGVENRRLGDKMGHKGEEIVRLARLNKRSLGEETLKSLRLKGVEKEGLGGMGCEAAIREREGVCSPWL